MKDIHGKLVLVDHERYEKDLLMLALLKKHRHAEVEYFENGEKAFQYLAKTQDRIFIIMSEMNMPGMSGLDLKKKIDGNPGLSEKAIPFVFASNTANKEQVAEAYEYRVQGYFKKPLSIEEQAEMLELIIRYWIISRRPDEIG